MGKKAAAKEVIDALTGVVDDSIRKLSDDPIREQYNLVRYDPPRGRPGNLDQVLTEENADRLMGIAQKGIDAGGHNWYDTKSIHRSFLDELGPEDGEHAFGRLMDYVAATSPRSKVDQNIRRASYLYQRERQGLSNVGLTNKDMPKGYGHLAHETQQHLVNDLDQGKHFEMMNRPKASSFAENLKGNMEPVTVDSHNMRAVFNDPKKGSPSNTQYRYMEQYQQDLARRMGIDPAQFQSAVWVAGDTGVANTKNFSELFDEAVTRTASRDEISKTDALKKFIRGDIPLYSLLAGTTLSQFLAPQQAEASPVKVLSHIDDAGKKIYKTVQEAWHGSPHTFPAERLIRKADGTEEFITGKVDSLPDIPEGAEVLQDFPLGRMRTDKIGTGEGAQAFGHGLYSGDRKSTATWYRDQLSPQGGDLATIIEPEVFKYHALEGQYDSPEEAQRFFKTDLVDDLIHEEFPDVPPAVRTEIADELWDIVGDKFEEAAGIADQLYGPGVDYGSDKYNSIMGQFDEAIGVLEKEFTDGDIPGILDLSTAKWLMKGDDVFDYAPGAKTFGEIEQQAPYEQMAAQVLSDPYGQYNTIDEAIGGYKEYLKGVSPDQERDKKILDVLQRWKDEGIEIRSMNRGKGSLYNLHLDAADEDLLNYNDPYSRQSDAVKERLKAAGFSPKSRDGVIAEIDKISDRLTEGESSLTSFAPGWYRSDFNRVKTRVRDLQERARAGALDKLEDGYLVGLQKDADNLYRNFQSTYAKNPDSFKQLAFDAEGLSEIIPASDPTGRDILKSLGDGEKASNALREAGIPGLRYHDGVSRRKGKKSFNYVMFDDKRIDVKERGAADPRLLAGMAGFTLAAMGIQDAEAGALGTVPEVVKRFGKTLSGVHYSKVDDPLRHLDGSLYGTGAKGAEARRVAQLPKEAQDRSFFYVDGSRDQAGRVTPRPEPGVEPGATYKVKVSGMYNTKENPLKLKAGSEMETRLKELGFNGYYNPETGMATSLQSKTEAAKLGNYRADAEAKLAMAKRLPDNPTIITAENAPSMDTEFGQWLNEQPLAVREKYADEVETVLDQERFMRDMGVSDYSITPGYGGYQQVDPATGQAVRGMNPNSVIRVATPEDARRVADARGFVTSQDAVPYYSMGGRGPLGIQARLSDGIGPELIEDIYRETGIDFTRTNIDALDFINYTDESGKPFTAMTDMEFENHLSAYFKNADGVEDVTNYQATAQYNPTGELWAGPDVPTERLGPEGAWLVELRNRVADINSKFQRENGFAHPGALALLAASTAGITSIAANVEQSDADQIVSQTLAETFDAAGKFRQLRENKKGFWQQRREELLQATAGYLDNNPTAMLAALGYSSLDMDKEFMNMDRAVRGTAANVSALHGLATGKDLGAIGSEYSDIMSKDSLETTSALGDIVHGKLEAGAGNSAMSHGIADMAGFLAKWAPQVASPI